VTLEKLKALSEADDTERIAILIELSGARGLNRADLAARSGSSDEIIALAIDRLTTTRRIMRIDEQPAHLLSRTAFESLSRSAAEFIAGYHKQHPLESGIGREELRVRLFAHTPPAVFRAVIAHGVSQGKLLAERELIRSPSHHVELAENEVTFKDQLSRLYLGCGLSPDSAR
jgi:selenocysteine-specific elongation factor